jgi:Flp pilus assembly protein TadD
MPNDDAKTLYKEGFDHFVNGALDDAVACCRRALDAQPEMAIAWNALAMALQRQGDLDGAVEAARKLIELEPDEPLGHTSLSMIYMEKGMIPEAEDEKAVAMRLQMKKQGGA